MDRTERFYRIELMIRSRGTVPFDDLLAELEVSRATLHRDLQYLRDRMDAPIVFDRDADGYRFERPATVRAETSHQLPGVWFSEAELHALLTMHQLIQGLDESGVLARHLQPLLDKLHGMLGASETEARELSQRVRIAGTARRPVPSRWFERIGDALRRRQRLRLDYLVRRRGERSVREVSPQRLVHYRHTWYLDAWCHGSAGLRRFALDAIESAALLEAPAKVLPVSEVAAALDSGYGIFGGGRRRWATLRFAPEAAAWVSREEWHPAQRSRWLPDGRYELRVPYVDETELTMDVLRHGEQVEVLAPAELRAGVASRLAAAAARYAPAVDPT
jgi:predicted DNA-binding transcriptional regulator YafY